MTPWLWVNICVYIWLSHNQPEFVGCVPAQVSNRWGFCLFNPLSSLNCNLWFCWLLNYCFHGILASSKAVSNHFTAKRCMIIVLHFSSIWIVCRCISFISFKLDREHMNQKRMTKPIFMLFSASKKFSEAQARPPEVWKRLWKSLSDWREKNVSRGEPSHCP